MIVSFPIGVLSSSEIAALTFKRLEEHIEGLYKLKQGEYSLTYRDDQGDQITISNDEDFITAIELNAGKNDISITVNLLGDLKQEEVIARSKPCAISSKMEENSESIKHSGHKGRHHHGHGHGHKHSHEKSSSSSEQDHCRRRKFHKMQEFMNERIASQVDERVKVLIPCIKAQLQASPVKLFSVANPIVHENTECKSCFSTPIVGIRYKCLTCPDFNICENCEANVEHDHNLLKMKKPEIKEEKPEPFAFPNFWKHHGHGHGHGRKNHGPGHHGPGHHGPWHHGPFPFNPFNVFENHPCGESSTSKDKFFFPPQQFFYMKKCKKLSKVFGGEPEDYQEFVKQYPDLRPRETIAKYAEEKNIDKVVFHEKLVNFKCQKLGKFFDKKPEEFKEFVEKNSDEKPRDLYRMLVDSGAYPESERCQGKWGKWSKWGRRSHSKKCNQETKNSKDEKKCSPKKGTVQGDIQKKQGGKGKVLKAMINLFGSQDTKHYLNLINSHPTLDEQAIIQLWLESQTKQQ